MNGPTPTAGPSGASRGIRLACGLAVLLLLLSFVRLIGDMKTAAFSFVIVEGALTEPVWKTRLGLNVALFFVVVLALHLAFGLVCWLLALAAERAFPLFRCTRRQWILLWFLAAVLWLLLANAALFPRSSLGAPYHELASTPIFGLSPLSLASAILLLAIAVVLALAIHRSDPWQRRGFLTAGIVMLAAVSGFAWKHNRAPGLPGSHSPHIVLLGIDSMRPDVVTPEMAPHMRAFLDGAAQLSDTVTPLARTFPAWTSILTGRHPQTTGATMNLLPREQIRAEPTLPDLLRRHGYRTYYAIDETRFSNIDASYGFDRTATPAIGGSDFLISWFGDTPLSNLVVNTWLGGLLFPHLHTNRAAHLVYDPDSFVQRVVRSFDFSKPSFLAVHFTLPHWPYTWASSEASDVDEDNTEALYLESIRRADRQFGDLLALLEARGVLGNALVIALSDHGEALGRDEDFLADAFPGGHDEINNYQKWGHGTSVFSPPQYQVVLGFRGYGSAGSLLQQPARLDAPVSLLDIAPTVLEMLALESPEPLDGMSLAALLAAEPGASVPLGNRIRYTETEYNPQGFSPMQVDKDKLALAAKVYRLDPHTDRILVRMEYMDSIMANRQYAALQGPHALATAIPGEQGYRLVYIPDVREGVAGNANEAGHLQQALQERFGIRFESNAPAGVP